MKLLKIRNLSKYVDKALFFNNANIDIYNGKICCLTSDSDARMKLFLSIIADQIKSDKGDIYFKNEKLRANCVGDKIGFAWHNESLFMNMSGFNNIVLKCGIRYMNYLWVNEKKLLTDIHFLLDRFDVSINLNLLAGHYNLNERTIIELISILLLKPQLSIFFKISRYLTLRQFETLDHILNEKKKNGEGIIYIPENLEETQLIGDRLFLFTEEGFIEVTDHKSRTIQELRVKSSSAEELNIMSIYDPIYNAKKIMRKSLNEEFFDVKELAEKVGLKYHVFRKEFKNKTGLSPKQFFINEKIKKAKELLLKTNNKIDKIAESLGFSDPLYFSRIFKSKEKISPNNYRKQKDHIFFR